jgi:hypothetical protein
MKIREKTILSILKVYDHWKIQSLKNMIVRKEIIK